MGKLIVSIPNNHCQYEYILPIAREVSYCVDRDVILQADYDDVTGVINANGGISLTVGDHTFSNNPTGRQIGLPIGIMRGFMSYPSNILSRKCDIFFAGKESRSRFSFKKNTDLLTDNDNISTHVLWNRWFNTGLSIDEYSKHMSNSKIALCPKGDDTFDTFRIFEAAKSGCIIISQKPPENKNVYWYYNNFPGVVLNNWQELEHTVKSLLDNCDMMSKLSELSTNWFNNHIKCGNVVDHILTICSRI